MTIRLMGTTIGGATVAFGVTSLGWIGAVVLITVILMPTLAICWIVADPDRPHRLAMLLAAWRHGTPLVTAPRDRSLPKNPRR